MHQAVGLRALRAAIGCCLAASWLTFATPSPAQVGNAAPPSGGTPAYDDPNKLLALVAWLSRDKRIDEAIVAGERLVTLRERAPGPNGTDLGFALDVLGALVRTKGDYPRAEAIFARALAVYQKAFGPNDVRLGPTLLNISFIARQRGDSSRALQIDERVLASYEHGYGPEDPAFLQVLYALEEIRLERKEFSLVEPLLQRNLAIVSKVNGPESDEAVSVLTRLGVVHEDENDDAGAEPLYQRVLAIREKADGPSHLAVADLLLRLAGLYRRRGDDAKALAFYGRALTIYENAPVVDSAHVAWCLAKLAAIDTDEGHYADAAALFERARTEDAKASGPEGIDATRDLSNLALVYDKEGDYARAEPIFQHVLVNLERTLGPDAPEMATVVANLAGLYGDTEDFARAQPLYERALAIREKSGSPEQLALALGDLAKIRTSRGDYARAEVGFKRALDILRGAGGLESADAGLILGNMASLYQDQGDYAKAQSLGERALAISEKTLGPEDPDRAYPMNNLADLYKDQGDYARAEPLYRQSLAIWTKVLGPDHALVALGLNNLGTLFKAEGDYDRAQGFLQRALAIDEKTPGEATPGMASTLENIASVYRDRGDYERAEPFYERALPILEKAFGPDHLKVALALNNLGSLFLMKGDYARAEALFRRALAITSNRSGLDQGRTLSNLAELYNRENDVARAEPLHRSALALLEASLGPDHPDVAAVLDDLASERLARGDSTEAEALQRRALAIAAKSEGVDRPDYARYQAGLAFILAKKGDYAGAEPLYTQAIGTYERAFGDDAPDLATMLVDQCELHWAKGDAARAIATMAHAMEVRERHVARTLSTGSEEQRRAFLATSSLETDTAVALHASGFPADPAAQKLAMLAVLRRKGRLLDVMSDTTRVLRDHLSPDDRSLFDRLRATRSDIARRTLSGPRQGTSLEDHRRTVDALERTADADEAQIASRSDAFRVAARPVTLEGVAAALPGDAALVEIVKYVPFDPRSAPGAPDVPPRYAAYVLKHDADVAYADLGEASVIDKGVARFRRALDDASPDEKSIARDLDERVMRPIRPLLAGTTRFVIAPDGALDLVPFAALVDENGRYLIESWSFSYLSTGRDLIRPAKEASRTSALVVANPSFDAIVGSGSSVSDAQAPASDAQPAGFAPTRSIDLRGAFKALPATEQEGCAVAATLPGAGLLTGASATTGAMARLQGPRILHIATHGFFLEDAPANGNGARGLVLVRNDRAGGVSVPANPLLRSGLAFAGANLQRPEDNGLVTALEASSLDLWGTKLVVLSACDTGVGEVRSGEGVYGLRRAFVLAGAESLVMSLWEVDNLATRDLMIAYYGALARGEGRSDALRNTQLRMIRGPYADPHFWASFVQYGEDGPLGESGSLPPSAASGACTPVDSATPPPVPPLGGARGCGCKLTGAPTSGWKAVALLVSVGLLFARRARRRRC
jgi:MYXO-CTERM domain-containing protein